MSGGLLATRTGRRAGRVSHLRACLPAAGLAALLSLAAGGAVGGAAVGLGAAAGVLVAAATFAFGVLVVDAADRRATSLVLPVGLAAYAVTVVAGGAAVLRWQDSTGSAVGGLPWGVVTGTAVWVGVQCWWAWTSPTPYVVLPGPDQRQAKRGW